MDKKEYAKKYYQEHKEKLLADNKKWCQENRKRRRVYDKQIRLKNLKKRKLQAKQTYERHKVKYRLRSKLYSEKNKQRIQAYHAARYLRMKAQEAGVPQDQYAKLLDLKRQKRLEGASKTKEQKYAEQLLRRSLERASQRLEILRHYCNGTEPRCACCGELEINFLTLDHINRDGALHRKQTGGKIINWLWKQRPNFPSGLQVLCYNCNCGREKNGGICPHKQPKEA